MDKILHTLFLFGNRSNLYIFKSKTYQNNTTVSVYNDITDFEEFAFRLLQFLAWFICDSDDGRCGWSFWHLKKKKIPSTYLMYQLNKTKLTEEEYH